MNINYTEPPATLAVAAAAWLVSIGGLAWSVTDKKTKKNKRTNFAP